MVDLKKKHKKKTNLCKLCERNYNQKKKIKSQVVLLTHFLSLDTISAL